MKYSNQLITTNGPLSFARPVAVAAAAAVVGGDEEAAVGLADHAWWRWIGWSYYLSVVTIWLLMLMVVATTMMRKPNPWRRRQPMNHSNLNLNYRDSDRLTEVYSTAHPMLAGRDQRTGSSKQTDRQIKKMGSLSISGSWSCDRWHVTVNEWINEPSTVPKQSSPILSAHITDNDINFYFSLSVCGREFFFFPLPLSKKSRNHQLAFKPRSWWPTNIT